MTTLKARKTVAMHNYYTRQLNTNRIETNLLFVVFGDILVSTKHIHDTVLCSEASINLTLSRSNQTPSIVVLIC